ncbi:hypothetical protein GGC65_000848 [Sphingopyxis sp. OAS728]|uniref:hypothetical protein n=1 Tax=Sphingopyxis sp. OAS728 TaxID=2663823 RepID=UPI0017894AED|nr:hypothetical protein [Sphingopyxis sp. OAS728]MBE1526392.1 hypothetical protein [Sphingopyxis sp. OAS728]
MSDWQTSIAHADIADWLTVAAYLFAAVLCARAARYARYRPASFERPFWDLAAVAMIFLGVNELLDLQTLLTVIGRAHAMANGWYPERRSIQYLFVVALVMGAVISTGLGFWLTRRLHCSVRLALGGLVFIAGFMLVRAASFHHLDDILGRGATEFPLGSIQEMTGILLVAVAALQYRQESREPGGGAAARHGSSSGD